jgi:carboxymethylenebutenolidase
MGGGLALTLATDTPLIKAVAPFYGANPNPVDKLADLNGPVLAIYAEHDAWISEEVRNAFKKKMDELGKPYEIQVYPGTEHAFFNDTRPEVYREGASKDAWERVLALFRAEL